MWWLVLVKSNKPCELYGGRFRGRVFLSQEQRDHENVGSPESEPKVGLQPSPWVGWAPPYWEDCHFQTGRSGYVARYYALLCCRPALLALWPVRRHIGQRAARLPWQKLRLSQRGLGWNRMNLRLKYMNEIYKFIFIQTKNMNNFMYDWLLFISFL